MALNACVESFWRIFFELIRYSLDNILFVIIMILLVSFIAKKLPVWTIALSAWIINGASDFIEVGTGGFGIPISLLLSFVVGILWAMMILVTPTNFIIKLPNMVLMFLFGFVWGIIPSLPLPLAPLVGFILSKLRIFHYVIGITSITALYLIVSIANPLISPVCSGLNYALTLF